MYFFVLCQLIIPLTKFSFQLTSYKDEGALCSNGREMMVYL